MSDVSKLPKWAQERIRLLEQEKGEAIKALNKYLDEQTGSCFSITEMVSTGEKVGPSFKTRFIQAHKMDVRHAGLDLSISTLDERGIELAWTPINRSIDDVAFIPVSFQRAMLIHPDNMRRRGQ